MITEVFLRDLHLLLFLLAFSVFVLVCLFYFLFCKTLTKYVLFLKLSF